MNVTFNGKKVPCKHCQSITTEQDFDKSETLKKEIPNPKYVAPKEGEVVPEDKQHIPPTTTHRTLVAYYDCLSCKKNFTILKEQRGVWVYG